MAKTKKDATSIEISSNGKKITTTLEAMNKASKKLTGEVLNITRARLKLQQCEYSYNEKTPTGFSNAITVKSDQTAHPDLLTAFAKLGGHLAVIIEDVSHQAIKRIDEKIGAFQEITDKLQTYSVDEIQTDGVTITLVGSKILTTGDIVMIKSPKISPSNYEFGNELYEITQDIIFEVSEYHIGKVAPNPQGDLFEEQN